MKLTQTLDTLKTNKQIKISTKRNPPLSYQTVEIKWFYRISYHWKKHGTRWNAKTTLKFRWFWFCFSSATCWFSITISSLSSCLTVEQDERCALIPVHLDTSIFSLYFIFLHHKGFIIDRKVWWFFFCFVFSPNTVRVFPASFWEVKVFFLSLPYHLHLPAHIYLLLSEGLKM